MANKTLKKINKNIIIGKIKNNSEKTIPCYSGWDIEKISVENGKVDFRVSVHITNVEPQISFDDIVEFRHAIKEEFRGWKGAVWGFDLTNTISNPIITFWIDKR